MDGYDAGMGLLNGLQQGLLAYQNRRDKNADETQKLGLLKVEKGFIPDPKSPGGFIKDPAFQKQSDEQAVRDASLKGEVLVKDPATGLLVNKGYNPDRLNQQIEIQSGKAAATAKAVAEADPDRPLKREKLVADVAKARKDAATNGTPDQLAAAGFAKRLEQSEGIFKDLTDKGYDRTSNSEAAKSLVADYLPADQKGQFGQQDQAERNFVNAQLRRESGSAISKEEFVSAEKQYFPRRGDTPEVLAQKAANRTQALLNLKAMAGDAYDKIPSAGTGLISAPKERSPKGLLKPGPLNPPTKTKEWNGKKYEMQGDNWVEVK